MVIKSVKRCLFAISVIALSANAFSKEISYDYIQGAYLSITDSSLGVDVDGDGFSLGASFSVSPAIAFTVAYSTISFDRIFGIEVKGKQLSFGVTGHTSVAPNTDVYANFSIANADVEANNGFTTFSDDDTGYVITGGLRFMPADYVELSAYIDRVDQFDSTSTSIGVGAMFYLNPKFALGVGYSTGDDVDTLYLGARYDIK